MLVAAYVFMLFSLALCWITIQKEIREKELLAEQVTADNQLLARQRSEEQQLKATIELQKLRRVPTIDWTYHAVMDGHHIQCKANGRDVGSPLNCRDFGSCGNRQANSSLNPSRPGFGPALKRLG